MGISGWSTCSFEYVLSRGDERSALEKTEEVLDALMSVARASEACAALRAEG